MTESNSVRILYLEDDSDLASPVPVCLEQAGYVVARCRYDHDGLACSPARLYAVVVVDQHGPGCAGQQIIHTLATHDPSGLTIILVAAGQERTAVAALQSGASEYLIKDTSGGYLDLLPVMIERMLRRKHAEESLRESEERYRTAADWTYDWEYWIDPTGHLRYVSPACERITGYCPEAFQTDPTLLETIVHPDDRVRLAEHLHTELTLGEATEVVFRIITRSGEERWIDHACQSIYTGNGNWSGRRASNRDITRQVRAEHALRASEERYREDLEQRVSARTAELQAVNHALRSEVIERQRTEKALRESQALLQGFFDHSPMLVYARDLHRRFLFINRRYEELVGFASTDVVGKTPHDILSVDVADQVLIQDAQTLCTRMLTQREYTLTHNGAELTFLGYNFPLYDGNGNIYAIGGISTDITDHRQAEHKFLRANRLYAVLSRVGEAVVRLTDRQQLFDAVCEIAIEQGLFTMVWIGMLDPDSQLIRPVARGGVGTDYLDQIQITIRDEPAGRGPTGTAMREGQSVLCNDISSDPRMHLWQSHATTYGFRSSAAFPITVYGHIIGALNLYSSEIGFFDAQETDLLERVVGNLAFALEKLDEETQRKRAEAAQRIDITRQEALLKLSEMNFASEREIVEFALEEAVRITHSTIGYLHFINDDQVSLQLFTWSRGVRTECYAEETTHYPLEQAGVWVDCVRQRRPVFHNDYQALPDKKGYPEGHIHLERHLSVPLIDGDNVVAVTGVGNKSNPYEEADARQLLLFMSGMWGMLQRKRVAAALRESEERYRRLSENALDIIYRIQVHPIKQFEYVSPAVTAVTGYTPEDHYADPDLGFKLIHPDDQHVLATVAQGERPFSMPIELRWIRKDGSMVWIEQRNVPIFDHSGTLVAIEGIARDITERRQAEAAYRSLVEHSLQGLLIFQDNRIVFANAMMSEINGYTVEEMLELSPAEIFALVYPDDQVLVQHFMQARIEGKLLPDRYEYRIMRKDGSVRWLEARGVRITYRGRYALQGAYIDITERKQAEQALVAERANMEKIVIQRTHELRRERDRTRAILEALGEAVMVIDLDGAIQYLNPAAIALTGFQTIDNAVSAQRWWWWQHADLQEPILQIQAAVQSGHAWRGEVVLRRVDNTHYDAAITVAPLHDPDRPDQPRGFVSVQRDITTMKTAERLKDQFVSNVSHELRSPMSLITMLVGSLEMLYPRLDDAKRLEIIGDIRKHARVLSNLISDVLEISRIDSGRIPTDQNLLNLAHLTREEIDNLLPIAERKVLTMEVTIEDDLPVIGHDGQIRQVIRNLINNAIKYTPDGGRIICRCGVITTGYRSTGPHSTLDICDMFEPCPGKDRLPPGRWATLCVMDSGIGISPDNLPHIFERFFRAQPQGDIPGTGLGLSIAWELVKRHGGFLEVTSTPNQGSSFALYLPLKEDSV